MLKVHISTGECAFFTAHNGKCLCFHLCLAWSSFYLCLHLYALHVFHWYGTGCMNFAWFANKFINWSVRVITKTGRYTGTSSEYCPHVCGCGHVMIGLWLPQMACDVVDWASMVGIIGCLLHCMVLKCIFCNDTDCHCMELVLECVVLLSVVSMAHMVLVVEVFSWLVVGLYVMVFSFVLTFDSSLQLVPGCLCCCLWPLMVLEVVLDLHWAYWMWCWRGNDWIFCVVGMTDCWHWGVLVILDILFVIWLWGVIYDRMFIIWLGYEMFKLYGNGDWLFIWLRLFIQVDCEWVFKFCVWHYIFQIIGGCVRLQCISIEPMCKCPVSGEPCFTLWFMLHGWVFVVVAFVSVMHIRMGGCLFLQLVDFTVCDCLSSGSLLGDLLHNWLLGSPLAALMYILVPGVWHFAIARHLLILCAVVGHWKICQTILGKGGSWNYGLEMVEFFTQIEMMVLKWLLFHTNSPEQGVFSSIRPVMVGFLHK